MSVNWAAYDHQAIYSMLQTSVDPGNIGDGVDAWREQNRNTEEALTSLVPDLNRIVSGGWRGGAADRALNALGPVDQWSATLAATTERITALMDASGSSAAQAKAAVPPPKSVDWGELGRSVTTDGLIGGVEDFVAQERAQDEAHAEAVRIMTHVYSAPINEYSAAVPTYPQLVDPTVQQPDQILGPAPAPGLGYPEGGVPRGGAGTHGGISTHGASTDGAGTPGGGVPSVRPSTDAGGRVAYPPPVPVGLQNVTSDKAGLAAYDGGQGAPDQGTRQPQPAAGEVAAATLAAAAGVPMVAPIAEGSLRRARAAGGGHLGVGGYVSGGVHAGVDHFGDFGPRPTSPTAEIPQDRIGPPPGRAGAGEMMAPMGGGRGPGGADSEHRRPSYLIEMNDVFTDGRKVAPAVIGEDLPEQDD